MADIQDTREFHTEVVEVCAALEGMLPWLEQESSDLGSVQRPIIADCARSSTPLILYAVRICHISNPICI